IMHDHLHVKKFCAFRIPHNLRSHKRRHTSIMTDFNECKNILLVKQITPRNYSCRNLKIAYWKFRPL
ncbi:hypothetical protein WH47_03669, partial [Habropoda laboriosa]